MAVHPFETIRDQDIQVAMANSNGVRHPLFIPGSQTKTDINIHHELIVCVCVCMYVCGLRASLLCSSESSFDLLVRKQISRLEQPGLQCVDLVYDEMIRMVNKYIVFLVLHP
jgi:hypothetical protein